VIPYLIDPIGPSRLDHLSCAEVAEFERLQRIPERHRYTRRYMELLRRRAPGWADHTERPDIVA